ncbi:IS200/IS605 family transposase [Olsenella sp. DNF00959]|uniref:IS200/IS605 family transposase n=1 Tax=Olsenella sp. DNF00959 TaxID=1476999 RepID=UPI000AE69E49|nr:IS200/IS605 family transposase [Olsenella sp. DNF00959]
MPREGEVVAVAQRANGLAHTKRLCKRHVVFAPKHRRRATCSQHGADLGGMLRTLCQWRGVETIEGRLMPDHVRMLASIPPRISASSLVGYPKGKSSPLTFDGHASLRHEFGNRELWAEGCYVSTVGPNEATMAKYIRGRERADIALGRPGAKECGGPFRRSWRHARLPGAP